jgi:hypothetical protein
MFYVQDNVNEKHTHQTMKTLEVLVPYTVVQILYETRSARYLETVSCRVHNSVGDLVMSVEMPIAVLHFKRAIYNQRRWIMFYSYHSELGAPAKQAPPMLGCYYRQLWFLKNAIFLRSPSRPPL